MAELSNSEYLKLQATFLVQTATNAPANAQVLSSLSTGLAKITTATGVVSIAVANTDFASPLSTFVVQTATNAPANSQVLGSLATGLLKSTTTTGVLSIAVANTDYPHPTATYIVQTSTNAPSGAQVLASLATGVLKSTTTTGVLSIAAANTDFADPTATYIVKTATAAPSNAQVLASLSTGVLKVTTTTGALTTAVANTDFAHQSATYIVQTSTNAPGSAQVLASLGTGLLKSTTTTGVLSIASSGSDYEVPLTFTTPGNTRSSNTVTNDFTTGLSGGQTLTFGTGSGDSGTLRTTSNATKGSFNFGTVATLILAENLTYASGAAVTLNVLNVPATTVVISGNTGIATAAGFNYTSFGQPTLSAASAVTVTNSATVYIANSPAAAGAGPATITNPYALWVDSGITRLDGNIAIGGTSVNPDAAITMGTTLGAATIFGAGTNTISLQSAAAGTYPGIIMGDSQSHTLRIYWVVDSSAAQITTGSGVLDISPTGNLTLQTSTGLVVTPTTKNTNLGGAGDVSSTRLRVSASKTIVSGTSAVWDAVDFIAATATVSGSTNITTATGFNFFSLRAPVLSAASALTISSAATIYVAGAPSAAGAGPATLTKAYSLWIDAGLPRIDSTTANGAVVTVLGSLGPTGSNTTVQEWLTVDINGTTRYLPCF